MTGQPVEKPGWRLERHRDGRLIWVRRPKEVKVTKRWMSAQEFLERLRLEELEEEAQVRRSREFQRLMEMPHGWSSR